MVALAFQLGNLALRSLALRNVLAAAYPEKRISAWTVGGAYAAGVALNAFAPARGGEALKIALLRLRIPGSSVPTLVSAGVLLTALDALIGAALIAGALGFGLVPSLPAPQIPSVAVVTSHSFAVGAAVLALVVAAVLAAGPLSRRARGLWLHVEQGGAILRTPARYVRSVVTLQLAGWACRTGVAFCLLAAFGLPATVPLAAARRRRGGPLDPGADPGRRRHAAGAARLRAPADRVDGGGALVLGRDAGRHHDGQHDHRPRRR